MTKRIISYWVPWSGYQEIQMPPGTLILSLEQINNDLILYVLSDMVEEEREPRKFVTYSNLSDVPDEGLQLVGSVRITPNLDPFPRTYFVFELLPGHQLELL